MDLVKRLDQCVKSCSVNAAKEALNPNTNAMRRQECSGHVPYLWRKYVYAVRRAAAAGVEVVSERQTPYFPPRDRSAAALHQRYHWMGKNLD